MYMYIMFDIPSWTTLGNIFKYSDSPVHRVSKTPPILSLCWILPGKLDFEKVTLTGQLCQKSENFFFYKNQIYPNFKLGFVWKHNTKGFVNILQKYG